MEIKINQKSKLFKVSWYNRDILISTFCIAKNKEDADKTIHYEYTDEISRDVQFYIKELKQNDKKDEWKRYEFCLNGQSKSVIVSTKVLSTYKGLFCRECKKNVPVDKTGQCMNNGKN